MGCAALPLVENIPVLYKSLDSVDSGASLDCGCVVTNAHKKLRKHLRFWIGEYTFAFLNRRYSATRLTGSGDLIAIQDRL